VELIKVNMMKKQFLAATLICCSASAFAIGSGVIVHDAKSALDTAAQWVKEAKQWENVILTLHLRTAFVS